MSSSPCEQYDSFVTHAWGPEEPGSSPPVFPMHEKVRIINQYLKRLGLKTWFDDERMDGSIIRNKMTEGITNSKSWIVCVTEDYQSKINTRTPGTDNCCFEFNYACFLLTSDRAIVCVLTPGMRNPSLWQGRFAAELATHLYFNFIDALEAYETRNDDSLLVTECEKVVARVQSIKNNTYIPTISGSNAVARQHLWILPYFEEIENQDPIDIKDQLKTISNLLISDSWMNQHLRSLNFENIARSIYKLSIAEQDNELLGIFTKLILAAQACLIIPILRALTLLVSDAESKEKALVLLAGPEPEKANWICRFLLNIMKNMNKKSIEGKRQELKLRLSFIELLSCLIDSELHRTCLSKWESGFPLFINQNNRFLLHPENYAVVFTILLAGSEKENWQKMEKDDLKFLRVYLSDYSDEPKCIQNVCGVVKLLCKDTANQSTLMELGLFKVLVDLYLRKLTPSHDETREEILLTLSFARNQDELCTNVFFGASLKKENECEHFDGNNPGAEAKIQEVVVDGVDNGVDAADVSLRNRGNKSIPRSFLCPISKKVMRNPVMDTEGNSYEKEAIMEWLLTHHTSPITRNAVLANDLVLNHSLREMIEKFNSENPDLLETTVRDVVNENISTDDTEEEIDADLHSKPILLVPVLDVISMFTLDLIKLVLKGLISSLSSQDFCSIVKCDAIDHRGKADLIVAPTPLTADKKRIILEKIECLTPVYYCNLQDGLRLAIESIASLGAEAENFNVQIYILADKFWFDGVIAETKRNIKQLIPHSVPVINAFGFRSSRASSSLLQLSRIVPGGVFGYIPDATRVSSVFSNAFTHSLLDEFAPSLPQVVRDVSDKLVNALTAALPISCAEERLQTLNRFVEYVRDCLRTASRAHADGLTIHFLEDLLLDCSPSEDPNRGQIYQAIQDGNFNHSGIHYLRSVISAYENKVCLNSIDLAMRRFRSPRFIAEQQRIEEIFHQLLPPIPPRPPLPPPPPEISFSISSSIQDSSKKEPSNSYFPFLNWFG